MALPINWLKKVEIKFDTEISNKDDTIIIVDLFDKVAADLKRSPNIMKGKIIIIKDFIPREIVYNSCFKYKDIYSPNIITINDNISIEIIGVFLSIS